MSLEGRLVVERHVLNLDPGIFCLLSKTGIFKDRKRKWPGIQILPAPEFCTFVDIHSFRSEGWLVDEEDVVIVRVRGKPAVLYVLFCHLADELNSLPHLEVRLIRGLTIMDRIPDQSNFQLSFKPKGNVLAHMENRGDVVGNFGEWIGNRNSSNLIEGFSIEAPEGVDSSDLTYQALLGYNWTSPWIKSGEFCGSRGLTLALFGLRIRLAERSAQRYKLSYSACFSDGKIIGPVGNDVACQSDWTAAMVGFRVDVRPRGRRKRDMEEINVPGVS